MDNLPTPYNSFSGWLKKRYGFAVRKVALTTPFGCPNSDGTLSNDGCIFCDRFEAGFTEETVRDMPVKKQLLEQIEWMEKRTKKPQKYMAYLQSGTNTYGDLKILKTVYQQTVAHEKVVAVAIGTRPDFISEDILTLIEEIFIGKDVWIELGVQTCNEKTLESINRNHTFEDTKRAIEQIKNIGFFVCAHLILGLPGENKEDVFDNIQMMNELKIEGVKLHPLSIVRNSRLEKLQPVLFKRAEYVALVADVIERLSPDIIIQRLVGGGRPEIHLAPDWVMVPAKVIRKIREELNKRGSCQGSKYK